MRSWVSDEWFTHVAVLEHPEAGAILVNLVPEPQPNQHSPRNIPNSPEIKRKQHDHNHGLTATPPHLVSTGHTQQVD